MADEFPKRYGKYLLLKRLARGGMAEVFLAKALGAEGFTRTVVIKQILPSFSEDEDFITMFIDEARIAALLHHQNIVQVIDFDRVGDTYYIAMEYVEGRDLRKVLDRCRRSEVFFSPVMAAHVAAQVAGGLHYAHQRRSDSGEPLNIIHRDVSPQNILLSFAGEVKITDFGIAKAAARSTKTRAGTVKGKVAYMSPEQAKGLPLDARSDIFALGTVLWEMLTCQRLFRGDTDFEILNAVVVQEIPPPSAIRPEVPKAFDQVVMKALARNREERYPHMGAFEHELQDLVFKHAKGREDIDIGAFVRSLFQDEIEQETRSLASITALAEKATIILEEGASEQSSLAQAKTVVVRPPDEGEGVSREAVSGTGRRSVPKTLPLETEVLETALPEEKGGRLEAGTGSHVKTKKGKNLWIFIVSVVLILSVGFGLAYFTLFREGTQTSSPFSPEDVLPALASTITQDASQGPSVLQEDVTGEKGVETFDAGSAFAEVEFLVTPPNAEVIVNGKKLALENGRALVTGAFHLGDEVEVEARAPGYQTYRKRHVIEAGQVRLSIALGKKRAGQVTEQETGFVTINARPWADVYYKGRLIGTTPVNQFEVPVGRQTFVLKNKTTTKEITVMVEKGQTVRRIVDM